MNVDANLLGEFENLLNPAFPEKSGILPEILGYGEISTTFSMAAMRDVAFKRMPPFGNPDQITAYIKAVRTYCALLRDVCGIRVSDYAFYEFFNRHEEHILYVAQPRLPQGTIGHNVLKSGTRQQLETMISTIMERIMRLFKFNHENRQKESIGLDGQLSNWSFQFSGENNVDPVYFDITTPLYRVNGKEQLDTEIFLKSCPSFLVWLVRWQFLDEVLDRYHDVRMILIDMVANFHKEGREDLIENALLIINSYLKKENLDKKIQILEKSEIDSYYKNDAFIWALFLTLRRFDRFVKTKIFRQRYNFILPGKISR
ncbi:MAG: hypothetical protein HF978_19640 [Desulfobacteraceae bacterium]|nr:hypothetical protein [Desulfobacteraceae bacterium]MBC2757762.1 hypothetical protein [Desulfobacteraceae bacterium]